ncbi:MAG: division/cell wall cluster transcriptional repressor MraZ [Eubacteriales bacterium]
MGKYTYQLDSKNRIFIPAKHREALGDKIMIFPNVRDKKSLIISDQEYYDHVVNTIKGLTQFKPAERTEMVKYLSNCGDSVTPDAQGRVVISADLVARVGLSGQTVISGCYDHAEITAAENYAEFTDEQIDYFASIIEDAELL